LKLSVSKGARMKSTGIGPCCFLLLALFSCLGVFASAQAAVLPDTDKLIPPETVFLAEIDNFSLLQGQFEKTNFYKLYKDPSMSAFVEDFKNKLREKIRKQDNRIAEAIVNAGVLPQGRVAIAWVLDEKAKNTEEAPGLFITQWGERAAKIKEAVEEQTRKAVEQGAHKKTDDYQGITIVTIIKELPPKKVPDLSGYNPESADAPPMKTVQPPPAKTHYCFIDDCLIGSDSIDVLKFVIAHIKGAASPTLAGDADYVTATRAVGPYHDIDFYVNIKQIIKASIAEDTTGQAAMIINNLGLDNVTSLGGSAGLSRQAGSPCSVKALLKINGTKKGICRMLEPESTVLRAPRLIPASACSATFFNLNIRKAYEELGGILTSFSPQAAAWMYMPLPTSRSPDEPGLKIKEDIIDHLGSQLVIAQSIKKPFSAGSKPTETFFALAVNNRNALEKSLSLLHSKLVAAGRPDARRELLGHTIYLVKMPGFPFLSPGLRPMQGPAAPSAPQMPTLAFTVTDTHLIFADESTVESVIRALSSSGAVSIDAAKWFISARSAIPSAVGLASLQDNVASGELSWRMMKESAKSKSGSEGSGASMGIGMSSSFNLIFSQQGLDLFNFGLLPEFDVVRKYFGLSAFYGVSRPDGFFFEFNYLSLPESK